MTESSASSEKTIGIGVRLPEALKVELENAAWAEGTSMSVLLVEGVEHVLKVIRQKHKGSIPTKPQRRK
jgi:hypothetical protein